MEVGAGTGAFSEMLLAEPRVESLLAVEPSEAMAALLRRRIAGRIGASVFSGFLVNAPAQGADTLVYVNVFEHIEDDLAEMRRAHDMLAPGGHLCIFVPALPWLYSEFDASVEHFRRYTPGDLADKLRKAGFVVQDARYFDFLGIWAWLIFLRWGRCTLSGGTVTLYDRWVVPVMRAVETLLPPPIGKNLCVVAQKTNA